MLAEERRWNIVEMLRINGAVRTMDLAIALGVSDQTIRRDLLELEKLGIISKTHGGGILKGYRGSAYEARKIQHREEKSAIAKQAALLVRPGMTVALAPGTTTAEIASKLNGLAITIITNSLSVVEYIASPKTKVLLTGGNLRPEAKALVGGWTQKNLADAFADVSFISVSGVGSERGYTVTNRGEALALKQFIRIAKRAVLATDSSKFYRTTDEVVAPLDAVHVVITDCRLPREFHKLFQEKGVKLVMVDPT